MGVKSNVENIMVEFQLIGENEIYVDIVVSKWSHLWYIAEWRSDNSWRLIKYSRKDSPNTDIKITISEKQAQELINKLNLVSENQFFRSAYSWRRQIDIDSLNMWRIKKYGNK